MKITEEVDKAQAIIDSIRQKIEPQAYHITDAISILLHRLDERYGRKP